MEPSEGQAPSPSTDSWRERFPTLSDWTGSGVDHPLVDLAIPDDARLVWENLLEQVAVAAPPGWKNKRRAFRQLRIDRDGTTNPNGSLWSMRTELVTAASLIRSGAALSLPERPDIVVNQEIGIEVTARVSAKAAELAQELEWLEQTMLRIADEKAHQAADVPTLLLVDVTLAGKAWLRSESVWASRLPDMTNTLGEFIGLCVVTCGYDLTGFATAAAHLTCEAQLPLGTWCQVSRALGLELTAGENSR